MGTCKKCRVRVLNPQFPTKAERDALSDAEIDAGVRLACMTQVFDGMRAESEELEAVHTSARQNAQRTQDAPFAAIADIGTTTVAVGLVDLQSKEIFDSIVQNNAQAPYGADVITRIKNVENDGSAQTRLITAQVSGMLQGLLQKYPSGFNKLLYVSGNTTMLHIFFGVPCASIGVAPYSPVFLESRTASAASLGMNVDASIISLPCVASFIGADITAGVVSLFSESERYTLLVDLGTNAEIVLFNKNKFFASSAAAGPAFEGANIRCGCAAVPGAVCGVKKSENSVIFETIDNAPAVGICGSGLIDIAAFLLEQGSIDATGQLRYDEYKIDGGVAVYPEDIRELQLAKSAVCSVAELLLDKAGIGETEVERLCLSGGFGHYINAENAAFIGLFPKSLAGKAVAVGNTSLAGTALFAADETARARAQRFAANAQVLDLSAGNDFYERFVENMLFLQD
jgi:uncharacterized 2Fe-2S/4Fe-4S cluster protein (DUF4445 family)